MSSGGKELGCIAASVEVKETKIITETMTEKETETVLEKVEEGEYTAITDYKPSEGTIVVDDEFLEEISGFTTLQMTEFITNNEKNSIIYGGIVYDVIDKETMDLEEPELLSVNSSYCERVQCLYSEQLSSLKSGENPI